MRRMTTTATIAVLGLGLAACDVDRTTGDRVLIGAGTGAAAGAVVGGLGSGTVLGGAAVGAAAGAAGGFVGDQIARRR
jgi:hypothetical protein